MKDNDAIDFRQILKLVQNEETSLLGQVGCKAVMEDPISDMLINLEDGIRK